MDKDGDERNVMRYGGGGRWHARTNKYLFRILHSTLLQRVWFPGSTALLMHPSTRYSHPQSIEMMVGTEREEKREQVGVGLIEIVQRYV